jgi:DNA-binding Lrp family transcriptional regulator
VAVTDPMDARLLAVLADVGRAAVHELAAKVGMDPREAAARLVALSGSGLPLLVGVECDPKAIRAAVAGAWHPSGGVPAGPGVPSGGFPAQGPPQGGSGPHQVHGAPSAAYPMQPAGYPMQPPAGYPVQGTPSAAYPVHGGPSGPQRPPAARPAPPQAPPAPVQPDPVISTWGPPQTASWARGDQQSSFGQPAGRPSRTGRIGDALQSEGLEQERLTVQLLEVQDPADYLFGAAGYRLEPGERAVVVHTEITNTGQIPFVSLPDNYLELIAADGSAIAKAPVSLTSRPPHKIGVQPGETLGGHTVYVLPDTTRVTSVRWSPRPEPDHRTLTWSIDD